jgi:hypothetical protein
MRRDAVVAEPVAMTRNPVLIASALLASLGPLVGNGLYAGPEDTDQRLAELRDGLPAAAYVAYPLEIVGFLATCVLCAWLTVFLFRHAPVAAVTTSVAGAAMAAVKLGSAAPIMVAFDMADDIDAQTAEILLSLNDMPFVISGLLFCFAFLAAGMGLLKTAVSRWLAWWPIVAGALGVVAGTVGIVAPDNYVPIPFLLLLVWMIALAIASAMGTGRIEEAVSANPALAGVADPQ